MERHEIEEVLKARGYRLGDTLEVYDTADDCYDTVTVNLHDEYLLTFDNRREGISLDLGMDIDWKEVIELVVKKVDEAARRAERYRRRDERELESERETIDDVKRHMAAMGNASGV